MVVAEYLFNNVALQVERLDRYISSMKPRFRLQKFSIPLVWTLPLWELPPCCDAGHASGRKCLRNMSHTK